MRLVLRRNLRPAPKVKEYDGPIPISDGLLYQYRDIAPCGVFLLLTLEEQHNINNRLVGMDPLVIEGKHNWYARTYEPGRARRITLKGKLSVHSNWIDPTRYVFVDNAIHLKRNAAAPRARVLVEDSPCPPMEADALDELDEP